MSEDVVTEDLPKQRRRYVIESQGALRKALVAIASLPIAGGLRWFVEFGAYHEPKTPEQVRRVMWLCGKLAKQLSFPGVPGVRATAISWYRFMIGLHRGEPMVREGFVIVVIGEGLSDATRREAAELIEFIECYGAQHGVDFDA